MVPEQRPARPRRRVAIPLAVGLALVAFLAVKRNSAERDITFDDAVSLAAEQGMAPAELEPGVGTKIYQWDPELNKFPFFLIGAVTEPHVASPVAHRNLVRIKSDNHLLNGSCLDIEPRQTRYWVKR